MRRKRRQAWRKKQIEGSINNGGIWLAIIMAMAAVA
jgi:hypothetical protein